ncbi:MAG: transposase, partial [Deltaproteobacteria bacterium]|nr:transposase [Deltaproteobacteria bacterium]
LAVFLGIELKFLENNNDYLIYGVTEKLLEKYPELYKHNLRSFRQFANQHDLLIYQAHPFRRGCEPANPTFLDGFEVFNGHPRQPNNNQSAKAYALKHKLNELSGTDYHELYDLGRGGIKTKEKIKSVEDFQRIIQTKNSFSLITSPENIYRTFL